MAASPTSDSVLTARGLLGVACRSGSPEEIAEARRKLRQAKADRMRRDADLLASGVTPSRSQLLITADGDREVTREMHQNLERAQIEESKNFLLENPVFDANGEGWERDKSIQKAWTMLMDSHSNAHRAAGCAETSPCLQNRSRS